MTKFATAALALCLGFSGLNAAHAASPKTSPAAPAAIKPLAVPAASKPAATTAFGTGVWRTVQYTQRNPVTGVWASDVQYISFGANGHFSEEIIAQGGNGQTGAGGVIEIVGTDKKLSATSTSFTMTAAELCVVYCQAYERNDWGTSLWRQERSRAPAARTGPKSSRERTGSDSLLSAQRGGERGAPDPRRRRRGGSRGRRSFYSIAYPSRRMIGSRIGITGASCSR